jgi:hypothetical protein
MKTLVLAIAGLLLPTLAAAQSAPCVQAAPDEPLGRIGAELAVLPMGTLKASAGNLAISGDTTVAMGVGGVVQHPIDSHFTVEFAPRAVFHLKGENDDKSATELDLRARLTAGGYVSPSVRLYGAFEPGYSFLVLPDDMASDVPSPNGLTIGLGAGAAFKAADRTMVTTEIGYQFGFQRTRVVGIDLDLHANLLHVALGVLFDL